MPRVIVGLAIVIVKLLLVNSSFIALGKYIFLFLHLTEITMGMLAYVYLLEGVSKGAQAHK